MNTLVYKLDLIICATLNHSSCGVQVSPDVICPIASVVRLGLITLEICSTSYCRINMLIREAAII